MSDSVVPTEVQHAVERRAATARAHLAGTIERRRRVHERLAGSTDPDDQAVARVYLDFLRQADQVRRSGAAIVLAAARTGDPVVGRMAVFDDDRDVVLVSWHSREGQRQLLADDRLLVSERPDGRLQLHTLTADDRELAARIRDQMRVSSTREEMADPLATLTVEQAGVLRRVGAATGDVVLHGPPGSGKSAIVMVELARRVLSDPAPERLRTLFVTGTHRLARRASSLGRLLGTASITPVPQEELLDFLGVTDQPTPQADDAGAVGSMEVPRTIERRLAALRRRLLSELEVPHPLGPVPASEVDAVRRWRARESTSAYVDVARGLAADLAAEYARIVPGERSRQAARDAAEQLRPAITPSTLVRDALDGARIDRALRTAAVTGARALLTQPGARPRRRWDLAVVDEYQRLPGVVRWLLELGSGRLLLSGDPMQSFTAADPVPSASVTQVSLETSLRMPSAIADWIDGHWDRAGLAPPRVRCAVDGGRVVQVAGDGPLPEGVPVIGPASANGDHPGALAPADAVGLEWPEVVLLAPDRIRAEHGPAGLFIAATRAIDTLVVAG